MTDDDSKRTDETPEGDDTSEIPDAQFEDAERPKRSKKRKRWRVIPLGQERLFGRRKP